MRRCFVAGPPAPCAGGCLGAWRPRSSSPLPLLRRSGCPPRACSCFGFLARPFPPSLRAFAVVRPACAGRCLAAPSMASCLPWLLLLFWRGVVAGGGRRRAVPLFSRCSEIRLRPPPARRLRPVAASRGFPLLSLCGFVLALAAAPSLVAAAFPFLFQLLPAAPSEASRLPKLMLPLWRQRLFRSSFGCSRLVEKLKARTRAFNFPTALLLKPPSPPAFFKMLPLFAACV